MAIHVISGCFISKLPDHLIISSKTIFMEINVVFNDAISLSIFLQYQI